MIRIVRSNWGLRFVHFGHTPRFRTIATQANGLPPIFPTESEVFAVGFALLGAGAHDSADAGDSAGVRGCGGWG